MQVLVVVLVLSLTSLAWAQVPARPSFCGPYTCSNLALCPMPVMGATCNGQGEWVINGNLSVSAFSQATRLNCALRVNGDLVPPAGGSPAATIYMNACGRIIVSGCLCQGTQTSLDVRYPANTTRSTAADGAVGVFTFGTIRFGLFNVIVGNYSLVPPETDSQYCFWVASYSTSSHMAIEWRTAGTCSNPPNAVPPYATPPPPVPTAAPTFIPLPLPDPNCTKDCSSGCPNPTGTAACGADGSWEITANAPGLELASFVNPVNCRFRINGNLVDTVPRGNQLTISVCSKIIVLGSLNLWPNGSRLVADFQFTGVPTSGYWEFVNYTNGGSGYFGSTTLNRVGGIQPNTQIRTSGYSTNQRVEFVVGPFTTPISQLPLFQPGTPAVPGTYLPAGANYPGAPTIFVPPSNVIPPSDAAPLVHTFALVALLVALLA